MHLVSSKWSDHFLDQASSRFRSSWGGWQSFSSCILRTPLSHQQTFSLCSQFPQVCRWCSIEKEVVPVSSLVVHRFSYAPSRKHLYKGLLFDACWTGRTLSTIALYLWHHISWSLWGVFGKELRQMLWRSLSRSRWVVSFRRSFLSSCWSFLAVG